MGWVSWIGGERGMHIKMIRIKCFEDLQGKSVRGLSVEAIAGGEIERKENLDSSLEVMSSL